MSLVLLFWGEVGKFRSPRVVPRERVRLPKFESRRGKLLRDGCACAARVKLGMRNVRRVHLTDIWSWYRVELRVGDHLGRSEELVSRCVECDLAEPESLASLGGSTPGVVDGILSVGDSPTDMDAPEPEWKYLSGFAVKKGAADTGSKGALVNLLAPWRGATKFTPVPAPPQILDASPTNQQQNEPALEPFDEATDDTAQQLPADTVPPAAQLEQQPHTGPSVPTA